MSDQRYEPNSNRYKEAQKKQAEENGKRVTTVVTSGAKTKKKSELTKLADVFIADDARNVGNYILMDVLVPAIKKAVSDIVTNGIDMILYGSSGRGTRQATNAGHVSYSSMYNNPSRGAVNARATTTFSYDNIYFPTRGAAEQALDVLMEALDQYKVVRVADLYDVAGLTCEHTYNKYGWTNLSSARVEGTKDGYVIKMPRAIPID